MDFELAEGVHLMRDTVRKFVDRELIPITGRPAEITRATLAREIFKMYQ